MSTGVTVAGGAERFVNMAETVTAVALRDIRTLAQGTAHTARRTGRRAQLVSTSLINCSSRRASRPVAPYVVSTRQPIGSVLAPRRASALDTRGVVRALARVVGAVAGQAEHQRERLLLGELLIADEGAPGVEAERDCDPGAQQCSAAASFPPRLGQHVGGVPPVRVVRREHGVVAGV